MDDKFPEIEDLEILKLRKQLQELNVKLQEYERILKENGLLDKLTTISNEEKICHEQIAKLAEQSAKGVPLPLEDIKVLEILVKTLSIAKGKPQPESEKKPKKKEEKTDVAKLLKLASEKMDE